MTTEIDKLSETERLALVKRHAAAVLRVRCGCSDCVDEATALDERSLVLEKRAAVLRGPVTAKLRKALLRRGHL